MTTAPGLTCARCAGSLYPRPATRTDEGFTHAGRCPRVCSLPECNAPHVARGYCRRHYARHVLGRQPRPKPVDQVIHLDDVAWMADTGETWTGACQRLSVKPKTLEKYLTEEGRYDLATRMKARETPLTAGSRKQVA